MSWDKKFDAERAYKDALQITKAIKYFDNHIEIINEIRQLAEQRGIDEKELEYHINKVYEAKNELESAVFNLVEPFEDAVRYADDDDEDLDEANMNDRFEKDFKDIFGDLGDKVKARKKSPDHGKTQAHQDKTKKIPRKDKYKDDYKKDVNESRRHSSILEGIVSKIDEKCPHCGGELVSEELMNEKKDACYRKVKSRYKVWPSAYASGALVKCRKVGASNWGNKSKKK